jgi:hypothetical protein
MVCLWCGVVRMVTVLRGLKTLDGLKVEDWERNTTLSDRQIELEAQVRIATADCTPGWAVGAETVGAYSDHGYVNII